MEGHGKIPINLFIAEIGFHCSIKRLFVPDYSTKFEMVCHFGQSILNL